MPSTTLKDPTWQNTHVIDGDLEAAVRELKAKPGRELQVHGSGALLRWLLERDLVDELNLRIYPVVVGDGLRLFPDRGPTHGLELVESLSTTVRRDAPDLSTRGPGDVRTRRLTAEPSGCPRARHGRSCSSRAVAREPTTTGTTGWSTACGAELGAGYDVRYPRMPGEDDPSAATWVPAIQAAIGALDDGAVVVGHSVGGTLLIHSLSDQPPEVGLGAIVLLAAPFVGAGGWPGDGFELPSDLGARLPSGVPVHLFHGLDDEEVPPAHVDRFAGVIPKANVHRLPGRDHQLGNDLTDVAAVIRDLPRSAATGE